jgi:Ca2+-binding EF-hand superfamily protein
VKITVDIPEKELRDAMRFTGSRIRRDAIVRVLGEFNQRHRMAELVKYSGTFSDSFPTNEEIEATDAAPARNSMESSLPRLKEPL